MSSIDTPYGGGSTQTPREPLDDALRGTKETAHQVAGDAQKAAADVGRQARDIAEDVRQTAEAAIGEVGREAQSLAEVAARDAKDVAEQGKGRMAAQIATIGAAISRAADDLEHHQQPMLADYARRLGGGVQQASHTMHEKGVEELFGMISDLARRQPAAFIGGAALLGFIASRFARSSARHIHAGDGGMAHPLSGAPSISEPWPISPTPTGRGATGIGGRGGAVSPLQPSEGGL